MTSDPTYRGRKHRALFAYALLAVIAGYMLLRRALDTLAGGASFQTADWLINYADGFVRRGLFGEVFLTLAPEGSAGLWTLFAVQTILYGVVFAFGVWALRRTDFSWLMIALVCGPAALGFFAWDPGAAFRKEVLAYVALAVLVWGLAAARRRSTAVFLGVLALIAFGVSVFSWETSALFVPAFVYLLLARNGTDVLPTAARRFLAAAFVAVGGVGLLLGVLFHGSVETATTICDAVRDHGLTRPDLCSGAIEAIGWSSDVTLNTVAASYPLYTGYAVLAALSFIPVVTTPWFRRHWVWALVIGGSIVPLFVIVTDYGRWINMIVMALLFCVVATRVERSESRTWNWMAAVLYTTLWGLPHYLPADQGTWPWRGLLETLSTAATALVGWILS
jgi:hypothetical protein